MSILSDVIKFKALEDQKEQRDIQAIGNTVTNIINLRRQSALDDLKKRNIESQISARENNDDGEFDKLIKRAKGVEAAISVGDMNLANQLRGQGGQLQQILPQSPAPAQAVNAQSTSTDLSDPKPGDVIPKGFDRFGNPTGFDLVKKTGAQEKRDVEIKELDEQIKAMVDLFRQAREEVGDIPGIGEEGIGGRIAGQAAVFKGKLGRSAAANVFQDRIKAFATTVAKAAGEVRPTDRDIERFINTLPTLTKNDKENEIIIDGLVNDLKARGAKAIWAERKSPVHKNLGLRKFNSAEEAESAKLPPGTKIIIGDEIFEVE